MKKTLSTLLSIILTLIFIFPASAADQGDSTEAQYTILGNISRSMANNQIGSVQFRNLSSDAVDYLEQFDIDTDLIGEISYDIDPDGILVLKAISLLEDGSYKITTITNYGQDREGNYSRYDNDSLINQNRAISWSANSFYGSKNYNGIITISASIYSFKGDYQDPHTGLPYLAMRPYKTDLKYEYLTSNHPSITNYVGTTYLVGELCYTDGTYITGPYSWTTYYNLTAPSADTTYSRINYLPSNEMINTSIYYFSTHHICTFYMNGSQHQTTVWLG